MYTAVVLTPESVAAIKERFGVLVSSEWTWKAHHMTVNMGLAVNGPAVAYMGQTVELTIQSIAFNDKVMAVGVECAVPSVNEKKHITLAVHLGRGGKPVMSNSLTNWVMLPKSLVVQGIVQEVS